MFYLTYEYKRYLGFSKVALFLFSTLCKKIFILCYKIHRLCYDSNGKKQKRGIKNEI